MKRRRTLLAIQFTNPGAYPPMEHLALLLAREGWRVEFRGLQRGAYRFELGAHPLVRLECLPNAEPGWPLVKRYGRFTSWVAREARAIRPDWIWASDVLAALPGLAASGASASPFVYQEHDAPGVRPARLMGLAAAAFRRQAIGSARFCVVPGMDRGRLLSEVCPAAGDVHVVWNCPRLEEVAAPRPPRRAGDPLIVYYHGTMSPDRIPYPLFQAVSALQGRVRLVIRGYDTSGHGEDERRLAQQIEASGAASWVRLEAPVSRQDLWPVVDECHVALALVPSVPADFNLRTMAGPSNKAFDGLARGLCLLVTDRPEWTSFFVAPGYALACRPEDPSSIADALNWFHTHPGETWEMAGAGRQRILDEWNYETQFAPVLDSLSRG